MLTKLNAIKVCKLLYICAIIYDFFYWITNNKKNYNILLFSLICIQLNFKSCKLRRAQMRPLLPDFLVIWLGFQKEVLLYYCQKITLDISAMSFH